MILNKIISYLNKKGNKAAWTRTDVLNHIISIEKPKNYLEIGVRDPNHNFNKILIKDKDGVDPNWLEDPTNGNKYQMGSDTFFDNLNDKKYDLIFIDGLHTYKQALKDINNAINHLSINGTILIHDCNPASEWHQRPSKDYNNKRAWYNKKGAWNGTTWKAFVELRCTNNTISMLTINTDHGLGLIKLGKQILYDRAELKECITWPYLKKHRVDLLNLISVDKFLQLIEKNR